MDRTVRYQSLTSGTSLGHQSRADLSCVHSVTHLPLTDTAMRNVKPRDKLGELGASRAQYLVPQDRLAYTKAWFLEQSFTGNEERI